jgi:hypothetical protein
MGRESYLLTTKRADPSTVKEPGPTLVVSSNSN